MHREAAEGNVRQRTHAQKVHDALTKVTHVNFLIGDFVMVCSTRGCPHNLASKLIGPIRIIAARSELAYEVEILDRTCTATVHSQRMLHYSAVNAESDVTDELKEYTSSSENAWYHVKELCDVGENNGVFKLLVRRVGWKEIEDETWELFVVMREDVSDLVSDSLHSSRQGCIKKKNSTAITDDSETQGRGALWARISDNVSSNQV